jgi:glycosyltransferase involved in cell wall biosynthesis
MAGRGPLKVEVQSLIETNGLTQRVALTEVPIDEVPEAIDSSSVSIVPSLWSEGTSLSAIESLVMGVPVVATDVGALASVIVPEFNGLVCSADPCPLADAVQRLLADKALYLSLARNALSMREVFSFARWTRTLDDALARAGLHENPEG